MIALSKPNWCWSSCYILVLFLVSVNSLHSDEPVSQRTFCNPIPIPNYPIGRAARDVILGQRTDEWQWRLGYKDQFRELADVTALWFDGKWFLYPSVDMAWVSEDQGATWIHRPLNVRDIGYAPTIVRHRGRFLLMASDSPIYSSEHPLGPFSPLGTIKISKSAKMPGFIDPMLFSDDDHRLFYYWGCSPSGGIWGIELDANDPTTTIGQAKELIPFRPEQHPWEAVGEWNQNPRSGWMEGAWMLKHQGKYLLTYCAGGTENRTYAVGCYSSDSPLGPFLPQKRNPILRTVDGLVTGTAHGSFVRGPQDELWTFYTVRAGVVHAFERRLGMDRASIDEQGELRIHGATCLPQWLPGRQPNEDQSLSPNWLPLNGELRTIGSSQAPNLDGRFAVDNDLRTWWQADANDVAPTLTTNFMAPANVSAVRIAWRDVGLDPSSGKKPGPIQYKVELETEKDQWVSIIDQTKNQTDLLIDYKECNPQIGTRARLTIQNWPAGLTPAVAEFTVFGNTILGHR